VPTSTSDRCRAESWATSSVRNVPVKCDDPRDIGHRVTRQSRVASGEQQVTRCLCQPQVAGQGDHNNRTDPTAIEGVPLHDDYRTAEARSRADRGGQLGPPDLALDEGGYHSTAASARAAAAATAGSAWLSWSA
jgi:hypothetical protein